jgi:hypothetical protein
MRRVIIGVIVALSMLMGSCAKKDKCYSVENAIVTSVSGPQTAAVNEQVTLTVNFYAVNGCGAFHSIADSRSQNTITVNVKVAYSGCVCTDIILEMQEEYVFTGSQPGVYTIVFNNKVLDDITHTITIN